MKYKFIALFVFCILVLNGCGEWNSSKKISGDYIIDRTEDGVFYLQRSGNVTDGGGIVEGSIVKIGWSRDVILIYRKAVFKGDDDGWMIVWLINNKIEGPISESEVRRRFSKIICYSPEDAWKQ